ncbi:type VII secretion target [Haloechinothrix sp. LS1_15]|uniref:WXG100 family type VII secretion target n=1 Tax=Haloechinothrix sp. LS1_15 TaxID=2652248 RepID=UPI00294683A3|nr:type VII secretion target [Haloechinothrix sp. LS1_15]MDV6013137.1 ESX-1 secretion-associated protein [Haloechinothrix sp. LS1_15]
MSASGFRVDPDDIDRYASDLGQYQDQASEIKSLVAEADVGDESWGIIGLFTKQSYTEALEQLQEQMQALIDGVETASEKFRAAARDYRELEDTCRQTLSGILDEAG